jgi:uncharacterized protein (TIRG00374 family)
MGIRLAKEKRDNNKKSVWYSITHSRNMDRKEYFRLLKGVRTFLIAAIVIGFLVFIGVGLFGGIGQVYTTILSANPYIYVFAFIFMLCCFAIRFIKWDYYLKTLGLHIPTAKNLQIYLSLYSMDLTPGKIGRIISAYTLNRITKKKLASIIPIVTMDIFTDFLGYGIVALAAAVYFRIDVLYILGVDILLILPFLFFINSWVYNSLKKVFNNGFIKQFTIYGDEYFASQGTLNNPKVYAVSLLVSIPAAFIEALALYASSLSIGLTPTVGKSVLVYSITELVGMISAIPGAIGVQDGLLVAFTGNILGYDKVTASAVTIMTRLATLWFGIAIGMVFLVYTFRYWDKEKKSKDARKQKHR